MKILPEKVTNLEKKIVELLENTPKNEDGKIDINNAISTIAYKFDKIYDKIKDVKTQSLVNVISEHGDMNHHTSETSSTTATARYLLIERYEDPQYEKDKVLILMAIGV